MMSRQDCILAPMLFNFCVNYLPGFLYAADTHMPKTHDNFILYMLITWF